MAINIDIESAKQAKAEELFRSHGIDMQTAITMFIDFALENEWVVYDIRHAEPSDDLLEAIEDARQGRNVHGPYTVEKAIAALRAD